MTFELSQELFYSMLMLTVIATSVGQNHKMTSVYCHMAQDEK